MLKVMIFGLIVSCFTACAGRQDDGVQDKGVQRASGDLDAFAWQEEKPSLVVFAAGWCKPCLKEIPYIENLNLKYKDKLEVFGYLVEGQVGGQAPTDEDIKNFDNKGMRSYPVYKDVDWELMSAVNDGPRILPAIYLFDKDRNVIDHKDGSITEEQLQKWVESKLNLRDDVVTGEPTPTSKLNPEPVLEGPLPEDGDTFLALEFFEFYEEETVEGFMEMWDAAVEDGTGIAPGDEEAKDYQIKDAVVTIDRENPDEEVTFTHIKLDTEFSSKCYTLMYVTLEGEYIGGKGYCLPLEEE